MAQAKKSPTRFIQHTEKFNLITLRFKHCICSPNSGNNSLQVYNSNHLYAVYNSKRSANVYGCAAPIPFRQVFDLQCSTTRKDAYVSKGHIQTLNLEWAREEHFLIFSQIFSHFLSPFGPLGRWLTHLGRPWLHHWWGKAYSCYSYFLFLIFAAFDFYPNLVCISQNALWSTAHVHDL